MSARDRLTIHIKSRKTNTWWVSVIACIIILVILCMMGVWGKINKVQAPAYLTDESIEFRLTVTGDIQIDEFTRKQANKIGYKALFRGVREYWADSDYVMANVNGPILRYNEENYTSTREWEEESLYLRPAALRGMVDAGINLLSFANDEVYNYGTTGITSTLGLLNEVEIDYLGIAENTEEALYKVFPVGEISQADPSELLSESESAGDNVVVNRDAAVAVMSVNDVIINRSTVRADRAGVINSSLEGLYQTIYELSQLHEQVVVYIHFGEQNSENPSEEQREVAHALVDAGATLVIGTHTHMLQSAEIYNDSLIVYGLGDLVTSDSYSIQLDSALLDLVVKDGETQVYFTPLRIQEGRPVVTEQMLYQKRIQNTLTAELDEGSYLITEDGLIQIVLRSTSTQN